MTRLLAAVMALSVPVACTPGMLPSQPAAKPAITAPAITTPVNTAPATTTPAAPAAPIGAMPKAAAADTAGDAQTAAQMQRDMDDMDMMADDGTGFTTLALGLKQAARPRVEIRAEARAAIRAIRADAKAKLKAQNQKTRAKADKRLKAAAAGFKKAATKEVVDNDLGGKTVTTTFNVARNGMTRTGTIVRVYDGEKALVSASHTQDWKGPNGATRHMERTKELQADGSYKVSGTATHTSPDGKTRTFTWTKTISADGVVSGTGTMTKADGTTKTITCSGTEEKETTTVADPATGTSATVSTSPETGTDATATVTEGGTTTEVPVTVETGAAAEVGGTETPAPTASPAAAASPEATPSPAASASAVPTV
jgi:hypothetical protein